ncbi:MAG: aminoacetone oxidase family FAD-binding enzyme [Rhodobacteraceae bacterium]|nr:aminoacetone oxidase family FAD-binding enzyme [Paracoccaceae bacterium]MBR29376.1 aminoacetone oxidase family FAD-binding enzyme [Paracoccaceae bacterium]
MPAAHAFHVIVLGAGAAGMMCAATAAARGAPALVIDHADAPGEKIRISGGGRCNFTNLSGGDATRYLSGNRHFAKSALGRYTPADFLALVARHRIAWHEKTLGQLFCDGSAREIVAMLTEEMARAGVELRLSTAAEDIAHGPEGWRVRLSDGTTAEAPRLVLATGGKSIPKMGATGFALNLAESLGLPIAETRPGLVPLTFGPESLEILRPLAGVATPAAVSAGRARFEEALLFTHRGLSGPAILQASSYWREGEAISVDLAPHGAPGEALVAAKRAGPKRALATALAEQLPRRLAQALADGSGLTGNLADMPDKALRAFGDGLRAWTLKPVGTEGWRTAEVMLGGVATSALDARTMEARKVPGLHVIGEAVDVTGWLGGYNFQWAWASGHAAGEAIADAFG